MNIIIIIINIITINIVINRWGDECAAFILDNTYNRQQTEELLKNNSKI